MANEDFEKNQKAKKRKKVKKDKWGQPLISEKTKEEQIPEQQEEEEEEENGSGGGGEQGLEDENSYEPNKVVVSGMPYSTTENEIRDLFKDIGRIHQLQLSRFPDSGNFRGLAFVTFQTEAAAISSLKLDGSKMGGRFVRIERCRVDLQRPPQRKRKSEFLSEPQKVEGCFSVYIGNLSWDVSEDDIRNFFESSRILSIRFATDKKSGAFRGFGHIDFEDDESLEEAMKKNQVELHGRPIKIAYAIANRS